MGSSSDAGKSPVSTDGDRGRVPITRRAAFVGAGGVALGVGLDRVVSAAGSEQGDIGLAQATVPFHGAHQAGIATPSQSHLKFAAFDVRTSSRQALRGLLVQWTEAADDLTAGRAYEPAPQGPLRSPTDTGEAAGLGAARLTLTFGFGPGLFERDGLDRFGFGHLRPPGLRQLPPFPDDQLDPRRSGGDVCVQACSDDPQVAFHAIHVLTRLATEEFALRWAQAGFHLPPTISARSQTPRNLLGFKDGTQNIQGSDPEAMARFVWLGSTDQPSWLHNGSYLIARRIELALTAWDALTLSQQERTIGRLKQSGAPLGGRREHDPVDLRATNAQGRPVIPANAHIRLASAELNSGQQILRRGYSFSEGTMALQGESGPQLDAGLFFIAFVRDPARQFIPIQRRLAGGDALGAFTVHTGSAVFACPPGVRRGGFIGQQLFQ